MPVTQADFYKISELVEQYGTFERYQESNPNSPRPAGFVILPYRV
jgi:hypothetical protein